MPPAHKAKVFKTGRSQAVRIPLEFRFQTDAVYIRRDLSSGELVLSPTLPRRKTFTEILAELTDSWKAA